MGTDARADTGSDAARRVALLLAVDPLGLGGARLRGAPGSGRDAWLDTLRAALPAGAPWRRLPLHADDDRLFGGLDLGATLRAGRPVLLPGLLAQADGGCVLLPMAERLPPGRVAALAAVLDHHALRLARDGMEAELLARVALIAFDEAGPDEPPLADALADRLAFELTPDPAALPPTADEARALADQAEAARQRWREVEIDDALPEAMVTAAHALGIGSLRAPLQALRAARALAALAGRRRVNADDAAAAAGLVLAPRATRLPAAPPEEEPADEPESAAPDAADVPPPPPPPPADPAASAEPSPPPPAPEDDRPPAEMLLEAALAALPPGLLALLAQGGDRRSAATAGRVGAQREGAGRGRPCGTRRGDPRAGGARLHLVATLRAAAPWQPLRRRERAEALAGAGANGAGANGADANGADANGAQADVDAPPAVQVRRDDFHVVRRRQRRQTTTVFVVDASGSAALHRLAEAKGAVELLLAECYVRRDRVALVSFRGRPEGPGAEVLLPPTRSLVRARRCLSALPGGGGTPLAEGLDLARRVVDDERRRGATPVVVVLSDGRANLARDGTPGREAGGADALAAARAWLDAGAGVLWLDTAPQPQPAAQRVAQAMGARYLPLPHADAREVSRIVRATAPA